MICLDLFPPSLRCPCCHSLWSQSTPSWITSKEGEFSVYPTLVILLLFIPVRRICEYTFVPGPFTAITEKVWQHIIWVLLLSKMCFVASLGCFELHCAEWWLWRLFSHSPAEGGKFLSAQLRSQSKARIYWEDLWHHIEFGSRSRFSTELT